MSISHFRLIARLRSASQGMQRGVVLFVALIVMVAMSLAAIALFRSVDTANLVAGNQSFKQSALNSTDVGLVRAMAKFEASGFLLTDANTHSNSTANCYLATAMQGSQLDDRGIPKLLLDPAKVKSPFTTSFTATYDSNCKITNANGDIVRYIIDRQCDASTSGAAANNTHCVVVSSSTGGGNAGYKETGSESIPLYRVSVRVDGPRNTVSYVQAVIKP